MWSTAEDEDVDDDDGASEINNEHTQDASTNGNGRFYANSWKCLAVLSFIYTLGI